MPRGMKRSDRTSITSIALSLRASPAGRGTGSRAGILRHQRSSAKRRRTGVPLRFLSALSVLPRAHRPVQVQGVVDGR
jgi:hypothetical protein